MANTQFDFEAAWPKDIDRDNYNLSWLEYEVKKVCSLNFMDKYTGNYIHWNIDFVDINTEEKRTNILRWAHWAIVNMNWRSENGKT